jgi:uncharacterized protein YndB with AHSA1/START domain
MAGRLTVTQEIEVPIETVFDLISDERNLKLWTDGLEETVYTSDVDRESPLGATFIRRIREGGRLSEYRGEVTAHDPPAHLAVTIRGGQFAMAVDYRLEPVPGGTRLAYSAELVEASWIARVFAFLFGWLTRRILRKQMAKLKAVSESRAAADPASGSRD